MESHNNIVLYSGILIIGSVQLGNISSVFGENSSYFTATNRSTIGTPLIRYWHKFNIINIINTYFLN